MTDRTDRRDFLNKTFLGAMGAGTALSLEEQLLLAAAPEKAAAASDPKKPAVAPGSMPAGKIGKVSVSRLFIGGNLIGGWAHSRDLIYTSKLFKAYNTDEKIFETLALCEQCGINTILIDYRDWGPVLKYLNRGGKMQTMVCISPVADPVQMRDNVKSVVDLGATMVYAHGEMSDRLTMTRSVDVLGKAIDLMKEQGVPGGVGSHSLETPMALEKAKLSPDFYVKTFHMDRYWSATPKEHREEWCWYKGQSPEHHKYHDNMWCLDAEATAAFMETVEKPWVAFKVMAAGAIDPMMAFPFAYRGGADFIVAGMFDFQVEYDAKVAVDTLRKLQTRKRPWRA